MNLVLTTSCQMLAVLNVVLLAGDVEKADYLLRLLTSFACNNQWLLYAYKAKHVTRWKMDLPGHTHTHTHTTGVRE